MLRRGRPQPGSLLLQHSNPNAPDRLALDFKHMLNINGGHRVVRHVRPIRDRRKFFFKFANNEILERVLAIDNLNTIITDLGFNPINRSSIHENSIHENLRTVVVKRLDSEFFYQFFNDYSIEQCKQNLLADLKDKVGVKVTGIHVIEPRANESSGETLLPRTMMVKFDTITNAVDWTKVDTDLSLGTILASTKQMHHNVSHDICTTCRIRNCNKNGNRCSGIALCASCLSPDHKFASCNRTIQCKNCLSTGLHTTGSNKCLKNREYIKQKLQDIESRRQSSAVANGNRQAIGRQLIQIRRDVRRLDSNINQPQQAASHPAPAPANQDTSSFPLIGRSPLGNANPLSSALNRNTPPTRGINTHPVNSTTPQNNTTNAWSANAAPVPQTHPQSDTQAAGATAQNLVQKGLSSFQAALMFASNACRVKNYDLAIFHKYLGEFLDSNNLNRWNFPNPETELIDAWCHYEAIINNSHQPITPTRSVPGTPTSSRDARDQSTPQHTDSDADDNNHQLDTPTNNVSDTLTPGRDADAPARDQSNLQLIDSDANESATPSRDTGVPARGHSTPQHSGPNANESIRGNSTTTNSNTSVSTRQSDDSLSSISPISLNSRLSTSNDSLHSTTDPVPGTRKKDKVINSSASVDDSNPESDSDNSTTSEIPKSQQIHSSLPPSGNKDYDVIYAAFQNGIPLTRTNLDSTALLYCCNNTDVHTLMTAIDRQEVAFSKESKWYDARLERAVGWDRFRDDKFKLIWTDNKVWVKDRRKSPRN